MIPLLLGLLTGSFGIFYAVYCDKISDEQQAKCKSVFYVLVTIVVLLLVLFGMEVGKKRI